MSETYISPGGYLKTSSGGAESFICNEDGNNTVFIYVQPYNITQDGTALTVDKAAVSQSGTGYQLINGRYSKYKN